MGEPVETISSDISVIKSHLAALFDDAAEHYPDGLIEISYGTPGPTHAQHFFVSKSGQEKAAEFAVRQNANGHNLYVGVNPRKPDTRNGHRTSARDIEIAFFQFADLDKEEHVERARQGLPIKPCMVAITGTMPSQRVHFYWRLEEPTMNMVAWSERQQAIARALGGDAVIDPPRVMRLAGTVNYPPPDKIAKGYQVERSSIRTQFKDERPSVSADAVAKAFPTIAATNVVPIHDGIPAPGQTTLSAMSQSGRTRQFIDAALRGDNWHNNVRDLAARLVRLGRTDIEIMMMAGSLTLPGYTISDTEREIRTGISSARVKFGVPEPDDDVEVGSSVNEDGYLPFEWFDDIEPQLNANWLVEDLIPQQGLTLVYGHPGSGKSFFALDVAMHVAMAEKWRDREVAPGLIIYIGAEGQRGLRQRIVAFKKHHRIDEMPFVLIPVEVDLLTGKEDLAAVITTIRHCAERFGVSIAMIVVDTLSRTFGGGDEGGPDMAAYVNNVGKLQTTFQCGAMIIHHRPKDSTNETPRGHGSLWGACDTILLVEDLGGVKQVKNTKQKDAEIAPAMLFNLKVIELGEDDAGKLVTSCVVETADSAVMGAPEAAKKLTSGQRITLEQLGQALEQHGVAVPGNIPDNAINRVRIGKVVSVEKWMERTVAALSGPDMTPDSSVRVFRRNRNRLQELEVIGVYGDYAWIVPRGADSRGQFRTVGFGQPADRRTGPDTPL